MKVLLYINSLKDFGNNIYQDVKNLLTKYEIDWEKIEYSSLKGKKSADAILVFGGDGTILNLVNFASKNNIPILGINAGKLGFLTEFEIFELEEAIGELKNKKLQKDSRLLLSVKHNNKKYIALNEVCVQRTYNESLDACISNVSVSIDNNLIENIKGDGVLVSTPTGSTAYSLSAGGPILAPGINSFVATPLYAHSFNNRPIVFSSSSTCKITLLSGNCSLVVDGKFAISLKVNDNVYVCKNKLKVTFLRKKSFNFYKVLTNKVSN
ncbi:MAG: NAD(+)/NADH kinase [Clostridia bacterium]|nr:NAD(+)/NADH kinase [Clostridia bacterium]